jgi:hypothetical protein
MIYRTWACNDCDHEFTVLCESSEGPPDCPNCSQVLEWRPGLFSINGAKSKAMDVTQNILETEFGLSNFRDNQREGDVAAIVPTQTETQRSAEIRQLSEVAQATGQPLTPQQENMAQAFWGKPGANLNVGANSLPTTDLLAGARQSTAMANAEGVNPMALLHQAGKKGHLKTPIKILARAKM